MNLSFVRAPLLAALLALSASAGLAGAPAFGPSFRASTIHGPMHDFAFELQGEPVVMRYMDVAPDEAERPDGGRAARQEFLRRDLGRDHPALSGAGYGSSRPTRSACANRRKPGRYQYLVSAACREHPCAARLAGFKQGRR